MSLINNISETEIEERFLLNEEKERALITGASFVSEKTFTDKYYDKNDFSLSKNDMWLRERAGKWELKVSLDPNGDKSFYQYEEVKDESDIRVRLSLSGEGSFESVLVDAGYSVFCECTTRRKKYRREKFTIDIDNVSYKEEDFIYRIAEIELMITNQKDTNTTIQEIMDFAKKCGLDVSSVLGKVPVYLKACRPDHFSELLKSGTVKTNQVGEVEYLNQKLMDKKCQIIIDPLRAPIIKKIFEKMAYEKWSGRKIYHWLKFEINFKTVGNHNMALSNVFHVLTNPIYYGIFEYPRKSGNWYTGKHEPIITKELYDKVQEQLKRDNIVRENKEFAFTKLFTCGYCGSGISAEEKWKQLKDGSHTKYIYYGCSRAKDRFCKNKYIREEELIVEILKILDHVNINELGMRQKLEDEITRFNIFQRSILGTIEKIQNNKDTDIRNYAKYILKEGTMIEKRELLANLRSRIVYKDRGLILLNE